MSIVNDDHSETYLNCYAIQLVEWEIQIPETFSKVDWTDWNGYKLNVRTPTDWIDSRITKIIFFLPFYKLGHFVGQEEPERKNEHLCSIRPERERERQKDRKRIKAYWYAAPHQLIEYSIHVALSVLLGRWCTSCTSASPIAALVKRSHAVFPSNLIIPCVSWKSVTPNNHELQLNLYHLL